MHVYLSNTPFNKVPQRDFRRNISLIMDLYLPC